MDKKVKSDCLCYQVLFNKPLLYESKLIYGFRIKEDELEHKPFSEKTLLEYIVEGVLGEIIFRTRHRGSFEGRSDGIWTDLEGNEYKYREFRPNSTPTMPQWII